MPKNAMGLHRSEEFMKANPEKAPKLHHMRITPTESGARVTHHAGPTAPSFASHTFGKDEGDELASHIMEHAGNFDSEGAGEDYGDKNEEVEA
jgi:hypothetical protein